MRWKGPTLALKEPAVQCEEAAGPVLSALDFRRRV